MIEPFSSSKCILAALHGFKPEKMLILYAMPCFSTAEFESETDRIRGEFFLELFVQKMVAYQDAVTFCIKNWQALVPVLGQLDRLSKNPFPVLQLGKPGNWEVGETLNLLHCLQERNIHMLPKIMAHRSVDQCRDRVRYLWRVFVQSVTGVDTLNRSHNSNEGQLHLREQYAILKTRMMREKYAARKEQVRLKAQCLALRKKVKALENNLIQFEYSTETCEVNESEETDPQGNCDIQDKLLCEMMFSSHQEARQRRYSDVIRDICQLIHLTSPRAYRLLKQFLPVPSVSCLRWHYAQRFALTRQMITDISMLDNHMDTLFTDIPKDCLCTIAIDAFAFRTFSEKGTFKRNSESTFSNAFLFMHIPLDPSLPPKVLHVEKRRTGAFDGEIMRIYEEILGRYRSREMRPFFLATDGDRYLTTVHEQFFKKYVEGNMSNFLLLTNQIFDLLNTNKEVMPISDPLHFAKNLRGKLLDHKIVVVDSETLTFTDAASINKYLQVGQALTDVGQIGRMRDKYVTDIFTLKNVCRLLLHEQYHAALLLLPYSCIFTVLYSMNLTNEARVFLVNLAFTAFERMLSQTYEITKNNKTVKHRYSAGVQAVTFAEPSYIKRMIHTCIALGISLVNGPQHVRLDSIGTHLVENAIGIARSVSNSTDYERIVSAFANSEMRKEIGEKWQLSLHVQHRINDGGAKVDTLSNSGLQHGSDWDTRDIVSQLHEQCLGIVTLEGAKEWGTFLGKFCLFVDQIEVKRLNSPSSVANALILQRNRCYQSKRQP